MEGMSEVTQILSRLDEGDPHASEELLPLVYHELRKLAQSRMAAERPDHTLQATALVHEAYVRLVRSDEDVSWQSRGHFFSAAAEAMRRILVESARRRNRLKREGRLERQALDDLPVEAESGGVDVLAIDESLSKLAELKPDVAELVKLRYFAGLTVSEAADALGVSRATADRHWTYARTWLFRALSIDSER